MFDKFIIHHSEFRIFKVDYIRLGKTNLLISRVAFGAMRLQSDENLEDVASVVRKAYDSGINFFDTSRKNPESEKLLGDAIYDIRGNVFLCTATASKTASEIRNDLEQSLMTLHCDYVDLFQLETEDLLPEPGNSDKIWETLTEIKKKGLAKHIGLVTTNLELALKAVQLDIFETLQFPFNMLCQEDTVELVKLCEQKDIGFIAMQPLCGGVVDNIPLAYGFLHQYENVIPIWGIKKQEELDQILYFNQHPPVIDDKFHQDVERIRNFFN